MTRSGRPICGGNTQAEAFEKQQAELAAARRRVEDLDAEIVRLRAEIKAAKAANLVRPDTHD